MPPERLLSRKAVAEILGIHPGSLTRLVRQGRFPAPIRLGDIGSRTRWRADDIREWIESKKA